MLIPRLHTLLATLSYVKPIQIYWRLWAGLKRRVLRTCSPGQLTGQARELKSNPEGRPPSHLWEMTSLSTTVTFDFLGVRVVYPIGGIPWNTCDEEKLWRYNLNYFDFLNSEPSSRSRCEKLFLILDWIEKNTNEHLESWEPYVVSKRVVNWITWLDANPDLSSTDGARARNRPDGEVFSGLPHPAAQLVKESLFMQVWRLRHDLEVHLQANHLLENFKALLLAGLFFKNNLNPADPSTSLEHFQKRNNTLLATGIDGFSRELSLQILADGGHYERSPMYHREILEGVCQVERALASLKITAMPPRLKGLSELCRTSRARMQEWLDLLTHPDGEIALFHDSAFSSTGHVRPSTHPLTPESTPPPSIPPEAFRLLEESGYGIARWGENHYLAFDCGEPGPAHQPGHSHCSALSYELSVRGKRLVVDSGCGSYQNPDIRSYCRSTAAHNVPWIFSQEQSECWGAFRMGRRSTILERSIDQARRVFHVRMADFQKNIFSRRVQVSANGLEITDILERMVTTAMDVPFESRLHLAPGWQAVAESGGRIRLKSADSACILDTTSRVQIVKGRYFPQFGVEKEIEVLCLTCPVSPTSLPPGQSPDSPLTITYAITFS